jgi:hypothetical protein
MIDMKQAVQIARQRATELLCTQNVNLEEIERDEYAGRKVWAITISHYVDSPPTGFAVLRPPVRRYNRLFIDIEDGELLAMKLREVSAA